MQLGGHIWTVLPHALGKLTPTVRGTALTVTTEDPKRGRVELTGRLERRDPRRLVMLIHGLGGNLDSAYIRSAANAIERTGRSLLAINLRGADRKGSDFYHAGLISDPLAFLDDPALAEFETIDVIGYSLGGHLALRLALDPPAHKIRSVVAVCPPLDLQATALALDGPRSWMYRRYVLKGLKEIYANTAKRGPVPTPVSMVRSVERIQDFDRLTVVPRFGFTSASDYYETQSVGPHLPDLRIPALMVSSRGDPMVPIETVEPSLRGVSTVEVVMTDEGGHVGFPPQLDLGLGPVPGLIPQVLAWTERQG